MAPLGGYGPVYDAFPDDGEPPSSFTLVGKAAYSNNFLHRLLVGRATTQRAMPARSRLHPSIASPFARNRVATADA